MGDVGDYWREAKEDKKAMRAKFGVECPRCKEVRPRAHPSILLPAQRCNVDGYRDPRPFGYRGEEAEPDQRFSHEDRMRSINQTGFDPAIDDDNGGFF